MKLIIGTAGCPDKGSSFGRFQIQGPVYDLFYLFPFLLVHIKAATFTFVTLRKYMRDLGVKSAKCFFELFVPIPLAVTQYAI